MSYFYLLHAKWFNRGAILPVQFGRKNQMYTTKILGNFNLFSNWFMVAIDESWNNIFHWTLNFGLTAKNYEKLRFFSQQLSNLQENCFKVCFNLNRLLLLRPPWRLETSILLSSTQHVSEMFLAGEGAIFELCRTIFLISDPPSLAPPTEGWHKVLA